MKITSPLKKNSPTFPRAIISKNLITGAYFIMQKIIIEVVSVYEFGDYFAVYARVPILKEDHRISSTVEFSTSTFKFNYLKYCFNGIEPREGGFYICSFSTDSYELQISDFEELSFSLSHQIIRDFSPYSAMEEYF